ncbi:uncharacterized protein EURHEDRAFT_373063 [Aspergillus ruber CBS 135680]|uniref:Uncharacterized protein n=1 Tax=Aspergillus ruber (strain CBS 135680) TaxID=1388766 RepID=A0A017RZ89_ASPRC|nr:uncharacterized protein EURHEDRAFT_373063 [Aspergillus ruber CBS 135680]EYE89906.1 hypothetical protein EURHEDRAFT_373063 [Aspergillus ruber CBS 135680]
MPSQRVALLAGGGVTICKPWGVCMEHVGLERLDPRVKCCSSVLLKSKFSSKEGEATSWQISSAYPKRPRRVRNEPCLKMGSMNSMKRIGEIGEPCGRPAGTWNVRLVWFPKRRLAVRPWVKLATHRITLIGHPCSWSCWISRPRRTASKAPCTSNVSMEAFSPRDHASSTSWIKAAARSVAERSGRAPNC